MALGRSYHIALGFSLLIPNILAAGQYANGSAVASCYDLDCNREGESYGYCNFGTTQPSQGYDSVGMVAFETPMRGAQNLTWTEGLDIGDPRLPGLALVNKDYYLGIPPGVDLRHDDMGYHGCAAFFVDSNATFPLFQTPGTCSDTIGGDCIRALQAKAADAAGAGSVNSANHLCSLLEDNLTGGNASSIPSECASVSLYEKSWGRVKFRPLTGPNAPVPPTPSQNASANCHPVIPASNRLASTLNFTAHGLNDSLWNSSMRSIAAPSINNLTVVDYMYPDPRNSTQNLYYFNVYQAVPILSVFAPADNQSNSNVTSAVSCIVAPWGPFLVKVKNAAPRSEISIVLLSLAVIGACFSVL